MVLVYLFLLFSAFVGFCFADAITPTTDSLHVLEGSDALISCNYSGSANNLQWYRQYPRSAPEFLLLRMVLSEHVQEAKPPHPRLSVKLDKENNRVDLEISSTEVTDSAVYYCALKPTVTGNPFTLYKNLRLRVKKHMYHTYQT